MIKCFCIRKIAILFVLCGILASVAFAGEWKELSSEHFIIYYTQDRQFARKVASKAEYYYRNIAADIGYPRRSKFWTWDNRAKIYIYADHESYLKATNQPNWSKGLAVYSERAIYSFAWSGNFLDSLLPHEIAHLIFRDFVGFKGKIPLWLDEGVAQWAEEHKRKHMKELARHLYESDAIMSLSDMMRVDIRIIGDKEIKKLYIRPTRTRGGKPGVLFLSKEKLIDTYYLQAVSLVGFLIEKYGSTAFADFCREMRDEKTVEEALRHAYPGRFTSLDDLEDKWRGYLVKGK